MLIAFVPGDSALGVPWIIKNMQNPPIFMTSCLTFTVSLEAARLTGVEKYF